MADCFSLVSPHQTGCFKSWSFGLLAPSTKLLHKEISRNVCLGDFLAEFLFLIHVHLDLCSPIPTLRVWLFYRNENCESGSFKAGIQGLQLYACPGGEPPRLGKQGGFHRNTLCYETGFLNNFLKDSGLWETGKAWDFLPQEDLGNRFTTVQKNLLLHTSSPDLSVLIKISYPCQVPTNAPF